MAVPIDVGQYQWSDPAYEDSGSNQLVVMFVSRMKRSPHPMRMLRPILLVLSLAVLPNVAMAEDAVKLTPSRQRAWGFASFIRLRARPTRHCPIPRRL